jgi:hypothetical protein
LFPENREKYREILVGEVEVLQIMPKIRDFRQLLRKGTGNEQETARSGCNPLSMRDLGTVFRKIHGFLRKGIRKGTGKLAHSVELAWPGVVGQARRGMPRLDQVFWGGEVL